MKVWRTPLPEAWLKPPDAFGLIQTGTQRVNRLPSPPGLVRIRGYRID